MARKNSGHKVTIAEMLRDVLVAGVNKGQLPQVTFALVLVVIVLKMPSADVTNLVTEVLAGLKRGYYLGWGCFVVTLLLWAGHAKWLRSKSELELGRVTKERNRAQQAKISEKIKSSHES